MPSIAPLPRVHVTDYATRSEVAALRRELRQLQNIVAMLTRTGTRGTPHHRLGATLAMIHAFAHSTTWTCGELVSDARRSAPDLWRTFDEITGSRGAPAVRLGLWLQKHEGIEADGLRLERVRQECGTWTYRVVAFQRRRSFGDRVR